MLVLYLYVCLFVSERTVRKLYIYETPMYLIMLHILYMFCNVMLLGDILHLCFDFDKDISITYQNSSKSVFYLFLWFKLLVLYNLGLCYSLDPD